MNGKMGQQSDAAPPPFTSTPGGSNPLIPAAMGMSDDVLKTKALEEGKCMHASLFSCFSF